MHAFETLRLSQVSIRAGRKSPEIGDMRPVPLVFWLASMAAWVLLLSGVSLGNPWVQQAGLAIMLIGGLPHGGHDLILAAKRWAMGGAALTGFVVVYLAIAALMAALWQVAPVAALALFLIFSAVHFAQDWDHPREPLLRYACGLAPIAAAALGNAGDVRALFTAMAGADGGLFQSLLVMLAPVTLLVAAAGLLTAWQKGERLWVAGQALAIVQLIVLPPLMAFPIYFAFLHSHRHITEIARSVPVSRTWASVGVAIALAIIAVVLWWLSAPTFLSVGAGISAALAFQLLSVVALPHLLFDRISRHGSALSFAPKRG